jgi:hypothetical protein
MREDLNPLTLILFKDDGVVKQKLPCAEVLVTPCGLRVSVCSEGEGYVKDTRVTKTRFRFFPSTSFSEAQWGREQ